jgi:hypothetical protein
VAEPTAAPYSLTNASVASLAGVEAVPTAPAFGLEARDGDLIESLDEQDTVSRITELRASGASLREICATLESEDRKSKTWKYGLAANGRETSIGSIGDCRMICRGSTDRVSRLTGLAAR